MLDYQGTVNSVCSRLYLNTHMFSNLLNFDIFCKKTWDYLKKKREFFDSCINTLLDEAYLGDDTKIQRTIGILDTNIFF